MRGTAQARGVGRGECGRWCRLCGREHTQVGERKNSEFSPAVLLSAGPEGWGGGEREVDTMVPGGKAPASATSGGRPHEQVPGPTPPSKELPAPPRKQALQAAGQHAQKRSVRGTAHRQILYSTQQRSARIRTIPKVERSSMLNQPEVCSASLHAIENRTPFTWSGLRGAIFGS